MNTTEAVAFAAEDLMRDFERELTIYHQERHEYECPYWRMGKKHGPCTCGGMERHLRFKAAVGVLVAAIRRDQSQSG